MPAVDYSLLERFDGYANLRNKLRIIGALRGEWSGIPMPVDGAPLVIEPTYPHAKEIMAMVTRRTDELPETDDDAETDNIKVRNSWYVPDKHATVYVYEEEGKISHLLVREAPHNLELALGSLSCSDAWGIEQESKAVKTLGTLLKHRQLKQYLLTGMFVEQSKRSGVHYIFRRLRPTVAFTMNGGIRHRERGIDGQMRILCALCMHPIGYYRQSWGGAMCPTDDILAHLMLMRGDERLFWSRSNQHPPWKREAGL